MGENCVFFVIFRPEIQISINSKIDWPNFCLKIYPIKLPKDQRKIDNLGLENGYQGCAKLGLITGITDTDNEDLITGS